MRAGHLLKMYRRFQSNTGIVGVAYGRKEVSGDSRGQALAVAFFVTEKLATRGARRTLADGRRRLPKFVELDGSEIPTDVVTVSAEVLASPGIRSPPQNYRAGGKISNMQLTGTLGCLVTHLDRPGVYAVTNQHIGLSEGTAIAFPDFRTVGAIVGTTESSVDLVADERFLPPFDQPQAYIDVDISLVRIPAKFENRFVTDIPNFGKPSAVFTPNLSNPTTFTNSLLGLQVFAYGWPSGPRFGTISHVYYVYQRDPMGMEQIATLLVSSTDAGPPGIVGDSGKLWMTKVGGQNIGVGIHSGVVADNPTSSRFAMVTELSSLTRFLRIQLA